MSEAIKELTNQLLISFRPNDCDNITSLLDSMPIITCTGKNKTGKVATEIANKGYCSTKNMYYFGIKLHVLASRREGTIPFPEMIVVSAATENNLAVFKREYADHITNKYIYADKIYSDFPFFKEREKAYNDLFSTAVSRVRQPIESFFNWLNEKNKYSKSD